MIDLPEGARAAGYIRLSQEDDASTSPERQRGDLQRLADANGWKLDVYEDLDLSAYSGVRRPGFEQLLEDLHQFDVLICWKLDRLVRRARDLPRITDACQADQVTLVSATEGTLGGGPGGQFILGVFAGLAELESSTISMRVKSSQQHLVATGRFPGGHRPYGYRPAGHPDGRGRILTVDEAERALVVEIARRVIGGESGREIAWDLNRRGILTSWGRPWSSRSLIRMLRQPTMIGQTLWRGRPVTGDDGLPVQHREPLLDVFTWRRVVAELDARSTGPRRRADSTLLGGLVRCGRCGATMTGWARDHPNAVYSCDQRAQRGPEFCGGNAISRMRLDEVVGYAIVQALTPARVEEARARLATAGRPDPSAGRIAVLEDALSKLERDRQVLGLYDDDEGRYVALWRGYTRELAELRARRPEVAGSSVADVVPAGGISWAWWSGEASAGQRRRVAVAAVREVTIGPLEGQKRWDPGRIGEIAWTWDAVPG